MVHTDNMVHIDNMVHTDNIVHTDNMVHTDNIVHTDNMVHTDNTDNFYSLTMSDDFFPRNTSLYNQFNVHIIIKQ